VGHWYQEASQGFLFEVVAFDEDDQTIEIQHLEGEVEEYDLDSWRELQLQPVEPPEDWRNAYELSEEDARDPDAPLHPEDWSGALNHVEPDDVGIDDDYWND
jgi:hypothetical protein